MKLGTAYVDIKAKRDGLKNDLAGARRDVETTVGAMKSKLAAIDFRAVGLAATAAAGVIGYGMKKAIDAASDLQEVTGKFSVVFKGQEKAAQQFADTLRDGYAMSRREAKQYLSAMQDLLVPMGMNATAAGKMSFEVSKLAADLGSFNNLGTQQVMDDMQSALVGNYETMKKYGVVLTAARVEQKALNMGLAASKKELDAGEKAMAAYQLIVEGSAAAIGDMARTQDSYANQQKKFGANLEELKTTIGEGLLPVATEFVGEMNEWFKANESMIQQDIPKVMESIAWGMEKAAGAVQLYVSGLKLAYKYHPANMARKAIGWAADKTGFEFGATSNDAAMGDLDAGQDSSGYKYAGIYDGAADTPAAHGGEQAAKSYAEVDEQMDAHVDAWKKYQKSLAEVKAEWQAEGDGFFTGHELFDLGLVDEWGNKGDEAAQLIGSSIEQNLVRGSFFAMQGEWDSIWGGMLQTAMGVIAQLATQDLMAAMSGGKSSGGGGALSAAGGLLSSAGGAAWDWLSGVDIPFFDTGAWNIARTTPAVVHQGEMVVPAAQAAQLRKLAENTSFDWGTRETLMWELYQILSGETAGSAASSPSLSRAPRRSGSGNGVASAGFSGPGSAFSDPAFSSGFMGNLEDRLASVSTQSIAQAVAMAATGNLSSLGDLLGSAPDMLSGAFVGASIAGTHAASGATSGWAKAGRMIGGAIGMGNPALGFIGSTLGGFVGEGLGDVTGLRQADSFIDAIERGLRAQGFNAVEAALFSNQLATPEMRAAAANVLGTPAEDSFFARTTSGLMSPQSIKALRRKSALLQHGIRRDYMQEHQMGPYSSIMGKPAFELASMPSSFGAWGYSGAANPMGLEAVGPGGAGGGGTGFGGGGGDGSSGFGGFGDYGGQMEAGGVGPSGPAGYGGYGDFGSSDAVWHTGGRLRTKDDEGFFVGKKGEEVVSEDNLIRLQNLINGGGGGGRPLSIIIQVGNEQFGSYVAEVADEVRVQADRRGYNKERILLGGR